MGRRYSRYEWALKMLGAADPVAGPLAEYKQYRTGAKIVSYGQRNADSKPGSTKVVGVNAFAFNNEDAQKILTRVSGRADTQKDTVLTPTGVAELGWAASVAAYLDRPGFTPAKAIVFSANPTQADTLKDSKVTGVKYNPREGASYTYPFGRKGTDGEAERASAIIGVLGAIGNRGVSFTPERVRL